jgi:hypothetical protein
MPFRTARHSLPPSHGLGLLRNGPACRFLASSPEGRSRRPNPRRKVGAHDERMRHNEIVKTYKVALRRVPAGQTTFRRPPGARKGNISSTRKIASVSFTWAAPPLPQHRGPPARQKELGGDPAGDMEIHGIGSTCARTGSLRRTIDWTNGWIAVGNAKSKKPLRLFPSARR